MLLLDTNILIDVLRGEALALAWLERQQSPRISVISWIEVLVGCRTGEAEAVQLRQRHSLKVPDAIILATARCGEPTLATRNNRDFPLTLRGVVHPYRI